MKKIEKRFSNNFLKFSIMFLPFILGFFGYLPFYEKNESCNYPVLWSIYSAIKLYGMSTDVTNTTFVLEVARWLAIIVTASVFLVVISSLKYTIWTISKFFCKSYIVYGDTHYARALAKELGFGCHQIKVPQKPGVADNHIIMFESDKDNIKTYENIKESCSKYSVIHLNLSDLKRDCIMDTSTMVFNIYENCARLFWQKYPVESVDFKEKIAIIGFSNLGQEILNFALLNNVYSVNQEISYNVFGQWNKFKEIHTEIDKIEDEIIFREKEWFQSLDVINEMDKIILCFEDLENLNILGRLLKYARPKKIFIKIRETSLLDTMFKSDNIIGFGTIEELSNSKVILEGELLIKAKGVYYNYITENLMDHPVEIEEFLSENPELSWENLPLFDRYSNIAVADNLSVKIIQFKAGMEEEMAETEHIRWCRYHYMNNWKYGKPVIVGEKVIYKNDKEKTHSFLVPYEILDEVEKQRDRDNVSYLSEKLEY